MQPTLAKVGQFWHNPVAFGRSWAQTGRFRSAKCVAIPTEFGQFWPAIDRKWAEFGQSQFRPDLARTRPILDRSRPTWAKLGLDSTRFGPETSKVGLNVGQVWPNLAKVGQIKPGIGLARVRPDVARCQSNLGRLEQRTPSEGCRICGSFKASSKFDEATLAGPGQTWTDFGQVWPASASIASPCWPDLVEIGPKPACLGQICPESGPSADMRNVPEHHPWKHLSSNLAVRAQRSMRRTRFVQVHFRYLLAPPAARSEGMFLVNLSQMVKHQF